MLLVILAVGCASVQDMDRQKIQKTYDCRNKLGSQCRQLDRKPEKAVWSLQDERRRRYIDG